MLWRVTITFTTAAGSLRSEEFEIERPSAEQAIEACSREVLRQPGRTIVGMEAERVRR